MSFWDELFSWPIDEQGFIQICEKQKIDTVEAFQYAEESRKGRGYAYSIHQNYVGRKDGIKRGRLIKNIDNIWTSQSLGKEFVDEWVKMDSEMDAYISRLEKLAIQVRREEPVLFAVRLFRRKEYHLKPNELEYNWGKVEK